MQHLGVVGVVVRDEIIRAETSQLNPGAKIPVEVSSAPGGYGFNVAMHVAGAEPEAGVEVELIAPCGAEGFDQSALAELDSAGIRVSATAIAGTRNPGSHVITFPSGERLILKATGTAADVWDCRAAIKRLRRRPAFDVVAFGHQPSDPGGSKTRLLIREAAASGALVGWNPGGTQIRSGAAAFARELPLVRVLTLNREEAIDFCDLGAGAGPAAAAVALGELCYPGKTIVMVTDGAAPAACFDIANGLLYSVPALTPPPGLVVDTTGAGDAFHAGMLIGLLEGLDLKASLELARQKAAVTCTGRGACPAIARARCWPGLEWVRAGRPITVAALDAVRSLAA
jgi:ribokinase